MLQEEKKTNKKKIPCGECLSSEALLKDCVNVCVNAFYIVALLGNNVTVSIKGVQHTIPSIVIEKSPCVCLLCS